MKNRVYSVLVLLGLAIGLRARAAVLYVDLNSPNPTPPYADWSTAATNIQDAIDAAVDGDQILVTNGWYQSGGKVMSGDLTNRVALYKAVTVQSANGPWATTIAGAGAVNGPAAVRCAWLTNGASLVGFRLMYGATRTTGDPTLLYGGGVWCASSNASVANCLIVSNTAYYGGGGVYLGTIYNSLLSSNALASSTGCAAYNANLNNCTIVSNSSYPYSCAVSGGRLTNCIVYYNAGGNSLGVSVASHCCTTPAPGVGSGNFTTPPQLFPDGVHLSDASPCIGAGPNLTTGADIFGQTWANPPSVGCAEWGPQPLIASPQVLLTSDPVGFTIGTAAIDAQPPLSCWWLKDGSPMQDDGHYSGTQSTNLVATGIRFSDAGGYQLVVSNAFGMVTSAVAQLVIHCVDAGSASPAAPYSTWATAATNIQDAISASATGEVVLVTNGLYATGGKSMDGVLTNRVTVDKAIVVQSVNGPGATVIQGAWNPGSTNGPGAVRCAWLTTNAVLSGFTLQRGATQSSSPQGGGVLGLSLPHLSIPGATVFNCLITGNSASSQGGGAYMVKLNNCLVGTNVCFGDGGGAYGCYLSNCVVRWNYAGGNGGGTAGASASLRNCALTANACYKNGGAAYYGTLVNCTLTANNANLILTLNGAAAYDATLTNCIAWGNIQPGDYTNNYYTCTLAYCCTAPLASGVGNISLDPQLLADGVHLSPSSPCRGAGNGVVVAGTDIDGQPWTNPPAIGCDEWQPPPVIAAPPEFAFNPPEKSFTCSVAVAGQPPFLCSWTKDGMPVQDDAHYSNSVTVNLLVNNFRIEDAGAYQVVVSNAFGIATNSPSRFAIHAVSRAGQNPLPPYASWATAATNIQDAIDIAAPGDLILVTNGVYATGGKSMTGDLLSRVALDRPVTATSINGAGVTVLQGALDPLSTNGPAAVRCAWLTNGAVLSGFTLWNGATRANGLSVDLQGGGAWSLGSLLNCVISNNYAIYGGGVYGGFVNAYYSGTLNNCLVVDNAAVRGGGVAYSIVNNCTIRFNYGVGAGAYSCYLNNSIIEDNYYDPVGLSLWNVYQTAPGHCFYCCSDPLLSGAGNIDANPQFLDNFHIASTSPCRGTGSAAYASGLDIDSEPWANPPSIGCDEVIPAALVGPLSVSLFVQQTNLLVSHPDALIGTITGHAGYVHWSFGDGPTITNLGAATVYQWAAPGDYPVSFTAYNNDNPSGVGTSVLVHVVQPNPPQLATPLLSNGSFVFQFTGQTDANYAVQYTTNLLPPVSWQTLQSFPYSHGQVYQIQDPLQTNGWRFYRVLAQ